MPTEAPEAPVETPVAPEIVIEIPKETPPDKPTPLWGNIKVGEKPAAEKPAETPEVTPEVKKTPEVTPKNPKEESLSELRKRSESAQREAAEAKAEAERLRKEYDEFKTKPVEIPEEVKTKLTKAEQERDEYLKEIRAVRIEKDPQFVEQFVKPIQSRIAIMQKVALEAGVDEATLRAGFGRWDKNTFGEWMEGMDAGQKAKFNAAWGDAEILEEQRLSKLQDANKTYEEMTQAREQESKTRYEADMSSNEKLAKGLIKKFILDNDSTKDFDDLPTVAETVAMRVARFEVTPAEVMEAMINNQALARMHGKQKTVIEERDAKIAELEKKVSEQDAFIKEHAGSTPRPDASGVIPKGGAKPTPLWDLQVSPR